MEISCCNLNVLHKTLYNISKCIFIHSQYGPTAWNLAVISMRNSNSDKANSRTPNLERQSVIDWGASRWRSWHRAVPREDILAAQVLCSWGCICILWRSPDSSSVWWERCAGGGERPVTDPDGSSDRTWRCYRPCTPPQTWALGPYKPHTVPEWPQIIQRMKINAREEEQGNN